MQNRDRLIPVPSLWHFFRFLRSFPKTAFHLEVAREINRKHKQLDDMINDSVKHVALYDNRQEHFHERDPGQQPKQMPNYSESEMPALRLVAIADSNSIIVETEHEPHLAFNYVDYQVRPFRTTNSEPETGKGNYGPHKDQVDLLLVNRTYHIPIVAEIKAPTDSNPFSALIQGLLYAISMTSPPQRARLAKFYPGRFNIPEKGPFVDLYLLGISKDDRYQEFMELIESISSNLLAMKDGTTSAHLRKIAYFDVELEPNELKAVLTPSFVCRSHLVTE